ncbi:YbaB/EbfC family nucleoid-associated protein [Nocardia camponoti]|uniref:YbaB/EbfC family DNA-binding protein n=1 Tax=Nocardia camponoti TaxID=1616106 RepID=A0A917VAC1_9NOCA|nr:YbaB/EbfC family nucleoid-associated protein [Nocardia camponoti]GGK56516.1 hypothetical protein GCM10011591_30750 [Nocardia camponoti]
MTAQMDALVAGVQEKLAALEAALYGLKQAEGEFTSTDGLVTARVDSNGALVDLRLAEGITSLPPTEAAELIVATCRQATEAASAERSKVVAALNKSLVTGEGQTETGFVPGPDSARG